MLSFIPAIGQVTKTGRGIPNDPYILKWKVTNVDTVIQMPTIETGNKLLKNYVCLWQIHYSGASVSDSKVYPVIASLAGDSMRCVDAVDTTLCILSGTGVAPYWKNLTFVAQNSPGVYYGFRFSKGTTRPSWIWFIQSYKNIQ